VPRLPVSPVRSSGPAAPPHRRRSALPRSGRRWLCSSASPGCTAMTCDSGNHIAASTGANLRDLMTRMGPDKPASGADLPAPHVGCGPGDCRRDRRGSAGRQRWLMAR
jgi:hypothetical protein